MYHLNMNKRLKTFLNDLFIYFYICCVVENAFWISVVLAAYVRNHMLHNILLCSPHPPLAHPQVEMPILPHGAESVRCQADLLLIPSALLTSKAEVSWSSLCFQDHLLWPPLPLFLACGLLL